MGLVGKMCWNGGQIFTSGLFFLKKRSSSKQKNNRNISLGAQPVHTMPPFLPRAEGVWGLAPRRVCAAQSLPDILTHLCSGAQSPLPAKPNTNASFTTALPHVISAATAPQSPRPGPKGGSCGRVAPRLYGDRRQRCILNHPVHEA